MNTRLTPFALFGMLLAAAAPAQQGGPPSPPSSSVQARVNYPQGVEALFDLTYASIMGYRPLKLDLYRPTRGPQSRPLVVFLHGGGWFLGSPRMVSPVFGEQDKVLARLAAHGYVVAGVTYRLSGEARFPANIEDVKGAIRWLRANASTFGIDPLRVAVWGESAGAYLAVLAGTSCHAAALEGQEGNPDQSSCVQAVVDFYGPIDFAQMDAQNRPDARITHNAADSPESRLMGCALPQCARAALEQANPLTYLKADAPPFLIMHGSVDTAVPIEQSRRLRDALKSKGVKVSLSEIQGVNHGFAGASRQRAEDIERQLYAFLDTTFGVQGPAGH